MRVANKMNALTNASIVGLVVVVIMINSSLVMTATIVQAQPQLKGEVMNSKYLEIINHSSCFECAKPEADATYPDLVFDMITGIVKNKSPEEITIVDIFVMFYDKDNNLIEITSGGLSPVDPLPATQEAKFEVKYFKQPDYDHYVIAPSGTP
jgi:hypothetical protein